MTTLDVLMDDSGVVGRAYFTRVRGQVTTTFIYSPDYLANGGMNIDPVLMLVSGAQHVDGLLPAFADSAPDRWGRNLIDKAERIRAREERRMFRRLDDLDYLLGVSDDTRQGALRFRPVGSREYLGPPSRVPRVVALPKLLHATDELVKEDDPARAVKELLETGTTGLGGARPKASVRLEDGQLAIAKFPHPSDRWDVMAWEATCLDLLEKVGVRTPKRRLTSVGDRSVLILDRFDRSSNGTRVPYISAMTATGSKDGDHRDYADIMEAMRDLSSSPSRDQKELFDRAVVNIALGNTDDHLRNHGFLAYHGQWNLSPVFDVNVNPDIAQVRSTSIMGADSFPDEIEGLLALADECNLTQAQARDRLKRIGSDLEFWRERARMNKIRESEITIMAESLSERIEAIVREGYS